MAAMDGSSTVSRENSNRRVRPLPEKNEVRVTQQGKTYMYISHAQSLLTEKGVDSITIKALGRAINKAVTIAEILKRRVSGLHQISEISSTELAQQQQQQRQQLQQKEQQQTEHKTDAKKENDVNSNGDSEQIQEEGKGASDVTGMRRVSAIAITLSFSPLDTEHIGYQPPLPPEELNLLGGRRGPVRGPPGERGGFAVRGRGGRGWNRSPGRGSAPRGDPSGATGVSWNRGGGSAGAIQSFQSSFLSQQQATVVAMGAHQPWQSSVLGFEQPRFVQGYTQSLPMTGMVHGHTAEQAFFVSHQQQQHQQQHQQQQQQQQQQLQGVNYATAFGSVQPVAGYQTAASPSNIIPLQQTYSTMVYGGVGPRVGMAGYPAVAPGGYSGVANVNTMNYAPNPGWAPAPGYGTNPPHQQVLPQWPGTSVHAPVPPRGGGNVVARGGSVMGASGGRGARGVWRGGFQGVPVHVQPRAPASAASMRGTSS